MIPLDRRVLGTRWEKEYIFDTDLKRPIVDYSMGCIPSVTVDSTPSIQTNRTEYHDLPSSITHEFVYYFPEVLPIDSTVDNIEFDEFEVCIDIPDRYRYLNINDSIDGILLSSTLDEFKYLDKLLTDYDKFAIPTVQVERMPYLEIEEHHYIGPNPIIQAGGTFNDAGSGSLTFDNNIHKFEVITKQKQYGSHYEIEYKQEFILKFADTSFVDATVDGQTFGETESTYGVLSMQPYFNLTERVGEYQLVENVYGDYILEEIIDERLLKKILTDYSKDKTFVNITTQEPHYINHVDIRPNSFEEISRPKYTGPNYEIKYDQETIRAFADIMFDATVSHLNTEGENENVGIVYHKRNVFSLADQVRPGLMFEKLDLESARKLITDRSYHDPGADIFDPRLERIYPEYGYGPHVPNERSLPLENKKQVVDIENIVTSKDFEKFIDSTMLVNDGAGDQTLAKLVESMFADVEMTVFEAVPTIINRPIEKTEIRAFLDTVIMGEQFEKFIDSSTKEQEIFTHLNLNQFADFKMNANSVFVEGNLINRPHEYANTAPKGNKTFIETILKGEYYEKFIDSNSKVVSELYEYTPGRANVVLKDLATIPWFSTNVSNITYSTLNAGWNFSTNSQNTSTNTIVYFSTAGPDYQVDLKPTYIDMALATQNTYAIPSANNGYLNANGWQYEHQQDVLPIPTANLQFESNRKIRMAVFEKFEFYITDIANTHNGYYFALGTSPWFDDNREANALFGIANGVTYELDGEVYTNFNQYKADFTSGLKANAKITFAPTISLAQLLGSDANSVNGASSDLCPTYNVYSANTYTFYYWSNANNTIFSAGGDIEIYELNNLEECIDYSINKTSYIDNIRVSKEVMFA